LFPIAEEVYIKGSSVFDHSRIRSKQAYVLDMSGDVGSAAIKAPSLIKFKVTVRGKAAHAGFSPSLGINALEAMCRATARLRQGQVDEETTFNIGKMSGGTALNIVPEKAECIGETRSFSHEKVLRQIELLTAAFKEEAENVGAEVNIETETILEAYKLSENEPVIKRFRKVCAELGLKGELRHTLGGSDNHNLIKNGIRGVVISCGMYNVHSTREYSKADELVKGVRLVEGLIRHS
ncbi:MAG: M20/M25/M40 family metallo-hydrolase, partial [Ruminococcus sp.]|nr:M20/M25/M40 family metallo-hydrolase [Ruminococcus sp.]